MNFFTFILSIYFFALSYIPCGDRQECNVKAEQTISVTTNHEQHSHTTEHCSPFCTCSCCSVSSLYQTLQSYDVLKQIFEIKNYPVYAASFSKEIYFSIWQPPKLS